MNYTNTEKLAAFRASIERQARERLAKLDAESKDYRAGRIKREKDGLMGDMLALVEKQTRSAQAESRMQAEKKQMEYKRSLLKKRDELADKVFEDARRQLLAFSEGEDYLVFLQEKAYQLGKLCDGREALFLLRPEDIKLSAKLTLAAGVPVRIREDTGIKLGGLRMECPDAGIAADETLDAALESQREWFRIHSGFCIPRL